AGGKWLIEAPYMLDAAKSLHVHLGWVVQTYNATEALANLIHPFWMLPLVGILGLKARDIVGYSMLQFAVHVPLVLFLVWALNYTLMYVPPVVPWSPYRRPQAAGPRPKGWSRVQDAGEDDDEESPEMLDADARH